MIIDRDKIILALDMQTTDLAMQWVERVDPTVCRLKVGNILFTQGGPAFVRDLVSRGFEVFLDLKFHDIPNTVLNSVKQAADLGVWMVNMHCLSGPAALSAVGKWMRTQSAPPLCIGVTILTSFDRSSLAAVGLAGNIDAQVLRLAQLAKDCGLNGVVCSAEEASMLKSQLGKGCVLVTPGIRLAGSAHQDQKRVLTPQQAWSLGADYLVVGRAITEAKDPMATLAEIRQQYHDA